MGRLRISEENTRERTDGRGPGGEWLEGGGAVKAGQRGGGRKEKRRKLAGKETPKGNNTHLVNSRGRGGKVGKTLKGQSFPPPQSGKRGGGGKSLGDIGGSFQREKRGTKGI